MEVKTKERVGPLSRRQCELMKNYLLNGVLPSPEEIKDAGFPFFDTILSDKNSYCRHRFKAWASKLEVTPNGTLVLEATGKELLPSEDIERVVMDIHCSGLEKSTGLHRRIGTVLSKIKETYSIGRRAFGPSENTIREIVNSCPISDCQFKQMVFSRQQNRNRLDTKDDLMSNVGNNLTSLSAGRIQDQIETARIGTVSPPGDQCSDDGNGQITQCVRVGKTDNYSAELYNWIGNQIEKSTHIHQDRNEPYSPSTHFQSGVSEQPTIKMTLPNLTPPRTVPCSTTAGNRSLKVPDKESSTLPKPLKEEFENVMETFLTRLSTDQTADQEVYRKGRDASPRYITTTHFGKCATEDHQDPSAYNETFSNTRYVPETNAWSSVGTDSSQFVKRDAADENEIDVTIDQIKRSHAFSVQDDKIKGGNGNDWNKPPSPVMPHNRTIMTGKVKPMDISDIPGDPTMSSKVFSVTQRGNTQPICSQANSCSRIILPKELPHIYPCASNFKQHGTHFDNNWCQAINCPTGNNGVFEEEEFPRKAKRRKWSSRQSGMTDVNTMFEESVPAKKSKWEELDDTAWAGHSDKHSRLVPSTIKASKLKAKRSKNRLIRPKLKEPVLHEEAVLPFVRKQPTLVKSADISRSKSFGSTFAKQARVPMSENLNPSVNVRTSLCVAEGNIENSDPMEALWHEMRKKYEREPVKQKLEIIDKIQSVFKEKSGKKSPTNHESDPNIAERIKTRPRQCRAALTSQLARVHPQQSSVITHSDQLDEVQPKIVSDDNNNALRPMHVRPGQMQFSTSTERRAITTLSDCKMNPNRTTATSASGQKKQKVRCRPPPAHTGSPGSELFTCPFKTSTYKKKLCWDNEEPIDLSIKSEGACHTIARPRDQVLDLSVKRENQEGGTFDVRAVQVPVASIKPMLPTKPRSDTNKSEKVPNALWHTDGSNDETSLLTATNRSNLSQEVEGRIKVMQTSRSSPTSTDEDLSEVTSLHVSVYMETPKKIARAEVRSNLPRQPQHLHIPSRVKQNQQCTKAELRSDGSSGDNVPSPPWVHAGEATPGRSSRCTKCSTSTLGTDRNRMTVTGDESLPQTTRKRSNRPKERPVRKLGSQVLPQCMSRNRNLSRSVKSEPALPSHTGGRFDMKQSFAEYRTSNVLEKYDEVPHQSKCHGLIQNKNVATNRESPHKMDNTNSIMDLMVPKKPSTFVAETVPTTMKSNIKRRDDTVSRKPNQPVQSLHAVPREPETSVHPCQNTRTQTVRNERRPRKKKQVEKMIKRSAGLQPENNSKRVDNITQEQTKPVTNMENVFDANAYLTQKRIEAYDINMKEAEKRKYDVLDNIKEQVAIMKEMYRPCLLDLGKANLDKVRFGIQKLLTMVRDCRNSLFREEAAAACIEALKDVGY